MNKNTSTKIRLARAAFAVIATQAARRTSATIRGLAAMLSLIKSMNANGVATMGDVMFW
jgi:hypothetical protein